MTVTINSKLGNFNGTGGGGGGAAWGSISGTLSNQADLNGQLTTIGGDATLAKNNAATALTAAQAAQSKFANDVFAGMTSAQILASGLNVKSWYSGYSVGTPGVVARSQAFTFTPAAGGVALTYTAAFDAWGKLISLTPYTAA